MNLSAIKQNPSNTRVIKDDKFKTLVKSITDFPKMLELRPMIVNDDMILLGGNMRLKALQHIGYTEIPDEWVRKALNDKWCTILFNAFLIDKTSTAAKMKGGNQTELYKGNDHDKKVLKAKSLEMIWPKYAETVIRFNRPHHFVDWKNTLNIHF